MDLATLKQMMDDGILHNEYVERHGCKRFEVANNINAVLVYSTELKSGDKVGGKGGKWTLSRVGVADKEGLPREHTMYMSTFQSPLPENGTPVILYGVEYDETEGKGDKTYNNLSVQKIIVVGNESVVKTGEVKNVTSTNRDRRIWLAGCLNTAIALVSLSHQVGATRELTEDELNATLTSATEWVKNKNPFES